MDPVQKVDPRVSERVLSVDLYRGVVMFLLIGEATGFFELLAAVPCRSGFMRFIGVQFQHAPWEGFRLADLGQPFFLFISGVALVFSCEKRWARGEDWERTFRHALSRSFLLFLIGYVLFLVNASERSFYGEFFVNILPQLAVAGLVTFLLLKWPSYLQAGTALAILAVVEILYRLSWFPGSEGPFEIGRNFGSWVDLAVFGRTSDQNVVALSIVPAVVYTVFGVLAAGILRSRHPRMKKLWILTGAGVLGVVAGLALSMVTPIIRRLETSSFVFLAAGLAFLSLALGYWLADIRGLKKRSVVFLAVGANPLFIFVVAYSGGADWLRKIAAPFGMSSAAWVGDWGARLITSLATWVMIWSLGYWLYKRRIYVKI